MAIGEEPGIPARSWPDYRAVWRWHFYAGLFCIPFVIVLSISGSIYLFKPQIEAWVDRAEAGLAIERAAAAPSAQVKAALASVPGGSLVSYEIPEHPGDAARVVVASGDVAKRVYVHPETLSILKTVDEEGRLMRQLFKLHGELWMGNRGSALVELAASWTIVMILTGLYLWWPRKTAGMAGVVYPRVARGSRIFWRDVHGVSGFWISGLTLFLLLSGLPWAKFWGDYFKAARRLTGTAVARQDWTNGATPAVALKPASGADAGGDHSGHGGGGGGGGGRRRRGASGPVDLGALDRVVAAVRPLALPAPVVINPPAGKGTDWDAKSMTANRPMRVDLVVDGKSGEIKERKDFKDRHLFDRIVGYGIAAHEGQLFGWPNQLLGLITAAGLVLVSMSSVVLWWRRRASGVLGAPAPAAAPRLAWGLIALIVPLAIYLPLFGASLALVLILDQLVLRRIPPVGRWLGLIEPL
ncbi:MAG: PepSY domain-containing protein [Isosphaeraceae bacterium]